MFPSKIPPNDQLLYDESEIFGDRADKPVDISVHRNCHVGMHRHDFYELNIVLSGSGYHYIEEMSVPASAGDVFVIPIGVYHGYLCGKDFNVAHILVKKSLIEQHYGDLKKVPGFAALFDIEPYLRQVYDRHLFLHLDAKRLYTVNAEIERQCALSDGNHDACHRFYALHLLSELSCEMQRQSMDAPMTENRDILRVLEYIQAHYDEKIGIGDLMKVANMSRPTLHRHFRKITNLTPMQYVLKLRLNAVKAQLAREEYPESKTQIAQKYGFFDTSHLNKHLHKEEHGRER